MTTRARSSTRRRRRGGGGKWSEWSSSTRRRASTGRTPSATRETGKGAERDRRRENSAAVVQPGNFGASHGSAALYCLRMKELLKKSYPSTCMSSGSGTLTDIRRHFLLGCDIFHLTLCLLFFGGEKETFYLNLYRMLMNAVNSAHNDTFSN